MGTWTYTYTYTGTEVSGQTLITGALPAFTGSGTFKAVLSSPTGASGANNTNYRLMRTGDATPCFTQAGGWGTNSTTDTRNFTVNQIPANWHCLNWDTFHFDQSSLSYHIPAGVTVTVTVTAANLPDPSPCMFGTRPTASAPAIAFITDATIAAACTLIGAPWLAVLFAPLIGYAIDTGVLCGSGPPTMPPITNQSLLSDVQSRLTALQSTLWYSVCECIPGSPTPVPYPPPSVTQPPGWPPAQTYSCDPANLCATITLILKRLDELSTTAAANLQLTTQVQRYRVPFSYVPGPAHAGLTGAGTFAIGRCVGVRVQVTAGVPSRQLEGTPPYLWNCGWISLTRTSRFLVEDRISQETYEWFPDDAQLADSLGYWLYPGVTITVTELQAVP